MDVLHPRCCGLAVHKSPISACILVQVAGQVQSKRPIPTVCTKSA